MTKSSQKGVVATRNNIPSYGEICHEISHFPFREGGQRTEILDLVDALRKIGYFQSFRVKENGQFSSEKRQKTRERKPERRVKARYRKMKKYYKSIKQYKKERLRRKLCWLLSGKYKETEIAQMLGISRRTVIRDMNKIKPYYFRLSRSYFSKLEQERIKEFNAQLEGKTLKQQYDILTKAIVAQQKLWQQREYRRHYQIIHLDMTQVDKYGIPKLTFHPKGNQTLAYPYKIRVHIRGSYEGRTFEADIGGFNIVQKTARGWW